MADFRIRSTPLMGKPVSTAWAALLVMQQHGFPTRLLDWTKSLAVASYFSARNLSCNDDGAIWVMATRHLLEIRGYDRGWISALGDPRLDKMGVREDAEGIDEFCELTPLPFMPDQLSPRMVAQKSLYTAHTFQLDALERLAEIDREKHGPACFLHKIRIPQDAKSDMLSSASVISGISEETLFPDLDGFSRAFAMEHERKARGDLTSSE